MLAPLIQLFVMPTEGVPDGGEVRSRWRHVEATTIGRADGTLDVIFQPCLQRAFVREAAARKPTAPGIDGTKLLVEPRMPRGVGNAGKACGISVTELSSNSPFSGLEPTSKPKFICLASKARRFSSACAASICCCCAWSWRSRSPSVLISRATMHAEPGADANKC